MLHYDTLGICSLQCGEDKVTKFLNNSRKATCDLKKRSLQPVSNVKRGLCVVVELWISMLFACVCVYVCACARVHNTYGGIYSARVYNSAGAPADVMWRDVCV